MNETTGIIDVDGREIYIGDIVEGWCNSHKLRGEVYLSHGRALINELYRFDGEWYKCGERGEYDESGLQVDYHKKGISKYKVIESVGNK